MIEAVVLDFFPVLMIYAACSDLLTMQISNRVSILLVVAFPPLAFLLGMSPETILLHMACGFVVLVLTFGLYCFGQFGGADSKLAAATSIWLGWENILEYGVGVSIYGGALALALILFQRWPMPGRIARYEWIARLHGAKGKIPYGIALGAAGLVMYPQTQVWVRAAIA